MKIKNGKVKDHKKDLRKFQKKKGVIVATDLVKRRSVDRSAGASQAYLEENP